MVDRNVDWKYPVLAAFITAALFTVILGSGFFLNDYKVDLLQQRIDNIEVEQNSRLIGQELSRNLDEDSCRAMDTWMNSTVDDLRDLRKEVASYENAKKIDNPRYETVKKKYMNLLLQNLAQVRQYDRQCEREIVDIIYFYSDDCDACQDQGAVLTEIRQKYGNKVVVYPLDTELGMPPIEFLQDYYGINSYPSVVVDGEVKKGFQSIDELDSSVKKHLNRTGEEK